VTELAPGWSFARLDTVARVQGGIQKQGKRQPVKNKYPFLRVANVLRGKLDLNEVHEVELFGGELDRYRLQPGDLLVVEGNGSPDQIGRAALWDDSISDCVHQNHLIRVRPSRELLPKFLAYAWNSPRTSRHLRAIAGSTSGLYTLSTAKVKAVEIPFCPISEQQRIVDILEDHLSRLDAASNLVSLSARKASALRRSALNSIIHRPGRPTVPLRQIVQRIEAGKSFGGASAPANADQWGIIKVSAMTWGEFKPEENKAVPAEAVDPRNEIRSGDLLVSRANTSDYVGASVLVGKVRRHLLLSDKSLRIIPATGVDPLWLWYTLSSPVVRQQISARATGTKDSMRNISQANLLSMEVPNIPLLEQHADAAELSNQFDSFKHLDKSLAVVAKRQFVLRAALLDAACSGRLSERSRVDLSEEMASV
jgi:type I restriction enzyme S subunit